MVNLVNSGDAVFSSSRSETKPGGFLKKELQEAEKLSAKFTALVKNGGKPASTELKQGQALLQFIEDKVEVRLFMEGALKVQSDSELDRVGRELEHVQSSAARLRKTMKAFAAN